MKFVTLIIFSLLTQMQSIACEAVSPAQINVAISTDYKRNMFYDAVKVLKEAPFTSINNCNLTAAKRHFVMISVGIENMMYSNKTTTYSISDKISDRACVIENATGLKKYGHEQIQNEVNLKRDFLNKCTKILVTDFSNKGIRFPEDQVGCKVERISKFAANFTGKFCYFSPNFDTSYSVQVDINAECKTLEGLKKNKVTLKDFNTSLDFFTSDVSTGKNNSLKSIGGSSVRFSVNPVRALVKPADDFGIERPVFPATWKVSNIQPGKLEIIGQKRYDTISLPLVVDTQCPRVCLEGACSSPCDYAQPVVGEHTLEVLENGKWVYISSWYDGAVIPGQWQGISYGLGFELPKGNLDIGSRYRVKVKFREPNLDFKYFDGDIKKTIQLSSNNIGSISTRGKVNKIPKLDTININEKMPEVDTISQLDLDGSLDGVERALRTLHSYLKNKFWPPFYEEICDTKGQCVENGKEFLELVVEFTLGEKESRRGPYSLSNVNVSRQSLFGNNYSKKDVKKFPTLNCGY